MTKTGTKSEVAKALLLALTMVTSPALADGDNAAERADRLFNEAGALVERGNFAAACPKLEESYQLDPALGTEYNLALCFEKIGRLGSAFRHHRAVERLAHVSGKKTREDAAKQKLADLRPRVSHFVFALPDEKVTIHVDGVRVEREDLDFYAVDTGQHVVEATAATKKPWRTAVDVAGGPNGAAIRVAVPALETDTKVVTMVRSNTKRTIGLAAGGVGLVGLGVAAVTGVLILEDKATADDKCTPRCVDQDGRDAVTRGQTLLPINLVAGVVGVVGLGVGSFLLATSGSSAKNAAVVRVQPYAGVGAAGITGSF